jgi:hypothetical protein
MVLTDPVGRRMGDKNKPREWSMTFDDRTVPEPIADTAPERTIAQAMPDFARMRASEQTDESEMPDLDEDDDDDPPTMIDPGLAEQLRQALEDSNASRVAKATVPIEGSAKSTPESAERTQISPNPFDMRVTPVVNTEDETLLDPAEQTQKARIPYDLQAELSLPAPAIERRRQQPIVSRLPRPAVPKLPQTPSSAREQTAIDIASALGIAPEPSNSAPVPKPSRSNAEDPPLHVPDAGPEPFLALNRPTEKAGPHARPSEGLSGEQLGGLAEGTERIARLLPVVLMILLVLSTIAVSVRLFKPEARQEHLELRFLALGQGKAFNSQTDLATTIVVDTEPPGILVLYDRDILGKTPFTAMVPVELENNVVVELSGPYFEKWIAEVKRGPAGDYTIKVNLTPKDR